MASVMPLASGESFLESAPGLYLYTFFKRVSLKNGLVLKVYLPTTISVLYPVQIPGYDTHKLDCENAELVRVADNPNILEVGKSLLILGELAEDSDLVLVTESHRPELVDGLEYRTALFVHSNQFLLSVALYTIGNTPSATLTSFERVETDGPTKAELDTIPLLREALESLRLLGGNIDICEGALLLIGTGGRTLLAVRHSGMGVRGA
jgi:hypothetical protein